MGYAPKAPEPIKPPAAADTTKAMLEGYRYAETQRKIRASSGRQSTFLSQPKMFAEGKSLLGT